MPDLGPEDFGLTVLEDELGPEDFGLEVVKGSSPRDPLPRQHPDLPWGLRAAVKTLNIPEQAAELLQRHGFEAVPLGAYQFAIKKPEEEEWSLVDEPEASFRDVTADIAGDVARAGLATWGAIKGGTIGSALGPWGTVGGVITGGALASAGGELGTQAAAALAGAPPPSLGKSARAVGLEAALGGVGAGIGEGLSRGLGAVLRLKAGIAHREKEVLEAVVNAWKTDKGALLAAARKQGIRAENLTPAELAREIYRRQPGREALEARISGEAKEFIHKGQGAPFEGRVRLRTEPRVREFTAQTGRVQPKFESLEALQEATKGMTLADLRVAAKQAVSRDFPKGMPGADRASREAVLKWGYENQPGFLAGGKASAMLPEDIRLQTLGEGYQPGWRTMPLGRTEMLRRGAEEVTFEPSRFDRAARRLLGRETPLGATGGPVATIRRRAGRIVEPTGRAVELTGRAMATPYRAVTALGMLPFRGTTWGRGAQTFARSPLGAMGAMYYAPHPAMKTVALGGVLGGFTENLGTVMRVLGRAMAHDRGQLVSRLLINPRANPTVKALARKALEALQTRGERAYQAMIYLLLRNQSFRQFVEGEYSQVEAQDLA